MSPKLLEKRFREARMRVSKFVDRSSMVLTDRASGKGAMNASDPQGRRVAIYASGLVDPAPTQLPSQVDGDPQYAALVQFLSGVELDASGAVVDVGAGEGVVARALMDIGRPDARPRYVAVDLPEPLEHLSLPSSIHNHSKKVEFDVFITSDQAFTGSERHVVIIRNVLHELDIETTSRLLCAINLAAPDGTPVYIQDMQELPTAESRNAPWSAGRLREALEEAGMHPKRPSEFRSHSGTPWYSMECTTNAIRANTQTIGGILCVAKANLQADLQAEYDRLDLDLAENAARALAIARDTRTIDVQLASWRDAEMAGSLARSQQAGSVALVVSCPVMISREASDLVHALPEDHGSGIVAVLDSKDVIDMAASIDAAVERVWFFGYSNKYAFRDPENVRAIGAAAKRGVDVSVVMVDPQSPAAVLRSAQAAYPNGDQLLADITDSLARLGPIRTIFPSWAQVFLTSQAPPCSFFIVDDFCVASYYTSHSRGTAGRSAVYRRTDNEHGFYEMLALEYQSTRLQGVLSTGSSHDTTA